ncbi:MAG: hypothetical protein KC618_06400, partial [Candidatus Omnitrophica bacterium]|nr:hypothetical protein [Candidatus Omnitrophota bacterium]
MTDNKRMIKKVLSNKILILIVIFQRVLSSSLYAIQIGTAEFQEQYQTNDVALKLHGVGLKTFLSIKIVAIALYLEEGTSPEDVLNDVPK